MEELKESLKKMGYTDKQIEKIVNNHSTGKMKPETLLAKIKENYNFLISLGYKKEDIIKMTKHLPAIYVYTTENMEQKISELEKYGYAREDIIKMTKRLPELFSYNIDSIKQKSEELEKIGYSKEDIIKMTKNSPAICGLALENIKQKMEDMKALGYSIEDIIKITRESPSVYCVNIETMKQKIEEIIKLGYSKEEVIVMTRHLPTIFGYSTENLKQKIQFYNSIGLHSVLIIDPNKLMQSVELSYARYMFFKDRGIDIDTQNYSRIFKGQKVFESQYGVTKEELLEKYDYKEYLKKKSTKELGKETIDEQKDTSYINKIEEVVGEQSDKEYLLDDK